MTGYHVAVVGATGAAGSTVLRILEERAFPVAELRALASSRSAGTAVRFAGEELTVAEVSEERLRGCDVVFLAAGAATARQFAPLVARGGGVAVDKSSAFRMDPDVPLIVPEVNGHRLTGHHGIVANPNCVATPLSLVLAPLQGLGLRRVVVATYQSASGAGTRLVDELRAQQRADAEGAAAEHAVYPHILHGNVVPGGWSMEGDDTEEEVKVVQETRRVLEAPELALSITTVRVPVMIGHSAAVWLELDGAASAEQVRGLLEAAPGVRVVDDPARQVYPTPRDAAGQDDVLVGRIREDIGRRGGVALFWCADNLRKGAATNAVQVAELAVQRRDARVA
jgi:aspartate-semialdehyde dehydrogenase